MIGFVAQLGLVEGVFTARRSGAQTSASIGFDRDKKIALKRNGQTITTFSEWFGASAALAFGPDDILLVRGTPADRRAFCDMLICQLDPLYCDALGGYKKSMLQKNFILGRGQDGRYLELYEQQMAESGAILALKRREVLAALAPRFAASYAEISAQNEAATLEYCPSISCEINSEEAWKNVFLKQVKKAANLERGRMFCCVGPHRDRLPYGLPARPGAGVWFAGTVPQLRHSA